MEPHKVPFLYNFSPVVVPSPLDWPEWIRVTGKLPLQCIHIMILITGFVRLLVLG